MLRCATSDLNHSPCVIIYFSIMLHQHVVGMSTICDLLLLSTIVLQAVDMNMLIDSIR